MAKQQERKQYHSPAVQVLGEVRTETLNGSKINP